MASKLKIGDQLWRVWGNREIDHVTIERITSQSIWFGDRAGLAFECRTRISHEEARRCGRSAREAAQINVAEYEARFHLAKQELDKARALRDRVEAAIGLKPETR